MTQSIYFTMRIAIVTACVTICSIPALADNRKIDGKVTDDTGESLPGVYVIEKGNDKNGTVTDKDGLFTLEIGESAKTLVFSFLGMQTEEIDVSRAGGVNFSM